MAKLPTIGPVLPIIEISAIQALHDLGSQGANDEYLRKNHERDPRHQCQRHASRSRQLAPAFGLFLFGFLLLFFLDAI